LRTKSNKSSIEKLGREISSGTFESIIKRLSNPSIPKKDRPFTRRSVKVKGKRKKETRLDTNVPLIQKDVKRAQAENYNAPPGTRKVNRFIPKIDKVNRVRSLPTESVSISERLGGSVTYADKRKGIKLI
jgi:hypothetical protein